MRPVKNIVGNKYCRLTVVSRGENTRRGHTRWDCICDCGNEVINVHRSNLTGGRTKSCGCFERDSYKIRREAEKIRRPLRSIRYKMISRCHNTNDPGYSNYGERGIFVCDEWRDSIDTFFNWAVKSGYKNGLEIDRIDNNKGYCPDNCRFTSRLTQANNKRNNVLITINGQTKTAAQWSRISGVNANTIRRRYKDGYMGMDLIDKPYAIRSKRIK